MFFVYSLCIHLWHSFILTFWIVFFVCVLIFINKENIAHLGISHIWENGLILYYVSGQGGCLHAVVINGVCIGWVSCNTFYALNESVFRYNVLGSAVNTTYYLECRSYWVAGNEVWREEISLEQGMNVDRWMSALQCKMDACLKTAWSGASADHVDPGSILGSDHPRGLKRGNFM